MCAHLLHVTGPVPGLSELQAFLEGPLPTRLPLGDDLVTLLMANPKTAYVADSVEAVKSNRAVALARVMSAALDWPWLPGTSEQHTMLAV
jgi:hypothetical protein